MKIKCIVFYHHRLHVCTVKVPIEVAILIRHLKAVGLHGHSPIECVSTVCVFVIDAAVLVLYIDV